MDALDSRLSACLPLAHRLCRALRDEAACAGLADDALPPGDASDARFHLERDPAMGTESLVGEWLDRRGHRVGMLLFHADGSFFAEHDIVRAHPSDPEVFIEAVEACGRGERIVCGLRSMPMCGAGQPAPG
jgi:hypothetical protein